MVTCSAEAVLAPSLPRMGATAQANGLATRAGGLGVEVGSPFGSDTGVRLTVSGGAARAKVSATVMPCWGLMAMAGGGRFALGAPCG